jgi:hypothetical protein
VSLTLRLKLSREEFPLPENLSERPSNFDKLSHITTVDLILGSQDKRTRLSGSSGSLL